MNKLKTLILALVIILGGAIAMPALAIAHAGHDETAQESLQVPEVKTEDIPQSSGFEDKNGNPISIDDYNQQREESTKGVLERYPVPFAILGIALVGSAGLLVYKKAAKK